MKIVDKEMFKFAQSYTKFALKNGSEYCWMRAMECLKKSYGL